LGKTNVKTRHKWDHIEFSKLDQTTTTHYFPSDVLLGYVVV